MTFFVFFQKVNVRVRAIDKDTFNDDKIGKPNGFFYLQKLLPSSDVPDIVINFTLHFTDNFSCFITTDIPPATSLDAAEWSQEMPCYGLDKSSIRSAKR